jgi:Uma2 family endonuclease
MHASSMSLAEAPPAARTRFDPSAPAPAEAFENQSSLVLPGYSWSHYVSLDELFQDTGVRVRFLDHYLEIMPPISEPHEHRKKHVACLLEAWCIDRDTEIFGKGSTTLKIPEEAGGEPDESYCFHEQKPRPDLVVEVALTSGGLSKRAFYAKFEIPELWIWREERLEVYVWNASARTYEASASSQVLPGIDLAAIRDCALLPSINQAVREFRKRVAPPGGEA